MCYIQVYYFSKLMRNIQVTMFKLTRVDDVDILLSKNWTMKNSFGILKIDILASRMSEKVKIVRWRFHVLEEIVGSTNFKK